MSYKTETHLHTKESSYCGTVPAVEIIKIYLERGYKTIFVTPHYHEPYLKRISDNLDERIDYLLTGFKIAKEAGDKVGINVLLGIEIGLKETKSDYLVYGITEEFLRTHSGFYDLSLDALIKLCQEHGFLIVQAHPFRDGMQLAPLKYQLPIEVFNGRHYLNARNEQAQSYAKEHNLIGISGTDFHQLEDIPGGIITETKIKTAQDFINLVNSRNFTIISSHIDYK